MYSRVDYEFYECVIREWILEILIVALNVLLISEREAKIEIN
jgi:hypothetical protein